MGGIRALAGALALALIAACGGQTTGAPSGQSPSCDAVCSWPPAQGCARFQDHGQCVTDCEAQRAALTPACLDAGLNYQACVMAHDPPPPITCRSNGDAGFDSTDVPECGVWINAVQNLCLATVDGG